MINVSYTELISWILTIVSLVLFILERRKNSRAPYYMAIQGILKACKTKAGFYSSQLSKINERKTVISKEEFMTFAEMAYSDFSSLMEHLMGSLKSLEPDKDMPFDTMEFIKSKREKQTTDSNTKITP